MIEAGLYVSLSGQLALQRRLDTVANNVANASTPGFRAENVTFETVLSRQAGTQVSYAGRGEATFSRGAAPLVQTGGPLDVAVQGEAFLAVGTPAGTVYTRDGRMRISANGELETMSGQPVLDIGGAPIQINAARGPVEIGRTGVISQNGSTVGTLGLYRIPADAKLTRYEGAAFVSDRAAEPVVDFGQNGVLQGFIESSNVNAVQEITRLISVSRAFEALSSSMDRSDRQLSEGIKALGSGR